MYGSLTVCLAMFQHAVVNANMSALGLKSDRLHYMMMSASEY